MAVVSSATATWQGDLTSGSGEVSSNTSEHLRSLPVTWAARTEDPQGRTTPEELLAAAHAACFSMAFSNGLAKAGTTAERLEVTAEVTFDKADAGWGVKSSHITVRGTVPGTNPEDFRQAAEAAKDGCPISKALAGNVALSVEATLDG
jgi:osmotically inducible protein OsmC